MHRLEFKIGVGRDAVEDMIAKAEAGVSAIEQGVVVQPVTTIRFETWDLFCKLMTPNRIAMIEHVARQERVTSIRALSIALGRDYAAVHADVMALVKAGLLGRDGTAITCDVEIGSASMASV